MQIGRRVIFSDVDRITASNVIDVLANAYSDFLANANDCDRLLNIEAGYMPLEREKTVRSDIDVQSVDSVANEITEFKRAYHWGIPITLVQRGEADSGSKIEPEAIALLNECYSAENLGKKQNALGRFVEICGIGYTFIDIKTKWIDGDSFFQYETLDPRFAFVIRSSRYSDHRIMLGVTFRIDSQGNKYFTAFTEDRRYEILCSRIINGEGDETEEWSNRSRSGERNPLGVIPIIEWERSPDRMGVFEREVPEMQRLNLIISDIGNDIDQETQMIWWGNDVEFPEVVDGEGKPTGEKKTPKTNEWVLTKSPRDGKAPSIKPLTTDYNYEGLLKNYQTTRTLILQRCSVPSRSESGTGASGTAMDSAMGWSSAEQVANAQQLLMESSKMEEVRIALQAIKKNPSVPADSPLLKLRYMDVKPNVMRNKTYELSTKINAFATGVSHGIAPQHMIKVVNMFDDPNQVIADSKPYMDRYLKSIYDRANEAVGGEGEPKPNADRLMQDKSDQVNNSPLIESLSIEETKNES